MSVAGTVAITIQKQANHWDRPVHKYTLVWVSTAGGGVSGTLTDYISGEIIRVVFIPGAGGLEPSDAYDLVLLDGNAVDVLQGLGANLSHTATTQVKPGISFTDGTTTSVSGMQIDDQLELQVSNAGASKGGTVVFYVR